MMNNTLINRATLAHQRHCARNALIFQQPCAALSSMSASGNISLINKNGKLARYAWNGKRLKCLDFRHSGRGRGGNRFVGDVMKYNSVRAGMGVQ